MRDGKIIEILCDYGLKASDLSACEWKQIGTQQPDGHFPVDEATMHRLARLVSVNKMLRKQKGGEPLTWEHEKEGEEAQEETAVVVEPDLPCLTPEEETKRAAVGLSPQEWVCVRGDYGVLLGISLCKTSFEKLWRKCKTKRALKLRGDLDKSKEYLLLELRKMAAEMIKKSSQPQPDLTMLHFQKKARELVRMAAKQKRAN
jgi:hypothetical protein